MGPAIWVMAILGCGEGDSPCEPVRTLEARYETRQGCLADLEAQLLRQGDAPYPVLVAECRRAGAPAEPVRANEIELPRPEPARRGRPAR